jgi:putative ABC transport system permease protein
VSFRQPLTLWKYSAREIQRRPGRTLLTLLGIVIGVAASVAISVTVQTTRSAHQEMFEAVTGRASLEVVADGLGGFDPSSVRAVQQLPGVKAAIPVVQTPGVLVGPQGAAPVLVLGVDPAQDAAARTYSLDQGRLLRAGDSRQVLLETGYAQANGLSLGKIAQLMTLLKPDGAFGAPGLADLTVVGLLEPVGAATFNGGAVVFLPLTTAQELFDLGGHITSLQLVLDPQADPAAVQERIRRHLPPGLTVQEPSARAAQARNGLMSIEHGLPALSASSLVAGAFVILNAFLMNLGERRRQLAILRALGATRAQVHRLLLREALLLGIAGTLVGIALGLALSVVTRQILGRLMAVTLPDMPWTLEPFLVGLALGPGMALAATYLPARRAGRRELLPDLLHQRGVRTEPIRRWPGYIGLAFLVGALLLVLAPVCNWLPAEVALTLVPPTMAMFLVGCVLVVPLILSPLSRMVGKVLRPLLGSEGGLALRQLDRHQGRTALTAGVLLIAVVFAIGFCQTLINNFRDIHGWLDRVAEGDFFVRGAWPDAAAAVTTAPLPESAASDIAALAPDLVERVDKFSYIPSRANGRDVMVLAYTYRSESPLPLQLADGDEADVRAGLLRGEVVLGTALGQRLGLGVGDTITVETRRGPRRLRIAGTATEYTAGGIALYLEWETARKLFAQQGAHAFLVTARPGRAAELAGPLRRFCQRRHYMFQSKAELREVFDRQMAGFLTLLWTLVALVFVVASLGIVNTLTMNVLEQTRELGCLRAIGMKRGQVRKMVICQALLLGVISLVPGVAGGIGLAYLMNLATYPLMGVHIGFRLDGCLVGGVFVLALVISVLAAYFPARRAGRLRVIEALQYE